MLQSLWLLPHLLLYAEHLAVVLFRCAGQAEDSPVACVHPSIVQSGERQQEEADEHPAVVDDDVLQHTGGRDHCGRRAGPVLSGGGGGGD